MAYRLHCKREECNLLKPHTRTIPYLCHSVSHLSANHESLNKGPGCYEGPRDLGFQLAGHVAERLQLVRVLADALQVLVCELVLGVEQLEHAFEKPRPEVVEHLLQVDVPARVVAFQLREQVLEHLGVLHVQLAVRPHEHVIQRPLRVIQQLQEEFYKQRNTDTRRM